ncbi:senescence-specific cysteine protease SAG39-like protein [Tanacetum coccineum]
MKYHTRIRMRLVLIPETTFVGVESKVLIPGMTFVGVESRVSNPETTFVGVESKVSSRVLNEKAMLQKYQQWMVRYGCAYRDNKDINKFVDQTKEEFIATHTGFKVPSTLRLAQNMKFRYDSVTGIPSSMDWR